MRKVIAATFVSLDGFMVGPNEDISWVTETMNEEIRQEEIVGQQRTTDTILLGRVTYQLLAQYWPNVATDENLSADHMNTKTKLVFSTTLSNAPWGKYKNARVVKDNIAEAIHQLKHEAGLDLLIVGSATLVQSLTNLGLVDEYRLLVFPVLLGSGKPLFQNITRRHALKLVKTKAYQNGVVVLHYQPADL